MTMSMREACPECGSQQFKRNGHIHNGKQNHQCKACGRQFVLVASNRVISEEHRTLVERLLCEKISLRGICRAIGVSIRWFMDFIVARFAAVPDHLPVQPSGAFCEVLMGCVEGRVDDLWGHGHLKGSQPDMTTIYCGHDFFEYLYCIISHLVILKLIMPKNQNFSTIFQKLQTLRRGNFLSVGKNGGRSKA
jgi:hypothetical protein